MINHGIWETYIPQEAPLGAPNNAIYWTDGSRDWYEFSRENWSVVAGVDASGTTKVSIFNGFVSCVATDVTRMALFGKFLLLELEEGEDTPELGWKFEGGQFVKPTSPEPDASTIPITRRQLCSAGETAYAVLQPFIVADKLKPKTAAAAQAAYESLHRLCANKDTATLGTTLVAASAAYLTITQAINQAQKVGG